MEPGRVSADTLRRCVAIAVTGSLLVMAGVMLGFAAQAVGLGGWPAAGVVAWGLIAAGMCCGVILIVTSGAAARSGPGRRRRSAPAARVPAGTVGQPGTSEEWIRALRPDAPSSRRGAPQ